jgi:spore germination protein GerM
MASTGRKKTGSGGWLLFWLAFFIGIMLLFMLNLERIKTSLEETRILDRLVNRNTTTGTEEVEEDEPPVAVETRPQIPEEPVLTENDVRPDTGRPPAENAVPGRTTAPQGEAKTVERPVYLMKVDNNGTILWSRVNRKLPASDSPLIDALEALIQGPSAEEEKQGLISLIPKNVKLLNATVRGNTAYISFSEDFLFNTFGVEGYVGQRRQIVLTATEFSNVKDVQILIDGKRIDYLGEGIWIGSPVDRNML